MLLPASILTLYRALSLSTLICSTSAWGSVALVAEIAILRLTQNLGFLVYDRFDRQLTLCIAGAQQAYT